MSTSAFSPEPAPVKDTHLRIQVESALRRLTRSVACGGSELTIHSVCDRDSDHYLVVAEGWQGYRRVYRTLVHVAVLGDDLHVYEDGTVDGIAGMLLAAGVPGERIICEWVQRPAPGDAGFR